MGADEMSAIEAAAFGWYGYGRWEAPYWFLGMEQGGDPEEASYLSWRLLGAPELLDCREHHLSIVDPLFRRWHDGPRPRTQPTWGGLIKVLLAFTGENVTPEAVRRYQVERWGSGKGETAVIELSALRARNLKASVARTSFRGERIATLRARLTRHRPTFVVCYGIGYRDEYEGFSGCEFGTDRFALIDRTLFVLMRHPTSFGVTTRETVQVGIEMRRRLAAR